MQQLLDGYGLNHFEHPAFISYPLEASLTIWGAGRPDVAVTCLGTAMSVSAGALEAEVIDLGSARRRTMPAGEEVAGKIVLLNGLATPCAVRRGEGRQRRTDVSSTTTTCTI